MMLLSIKNVIIVIMKKVEKYLKEVLGINIMYQKMPSNMLSKLPLFLKGIGQYYEVTMHKRKVIVLKVFEKELTPNMLESRVSAIETEIGLPVILWFDHIPHYQRKRLVQQRLAFVVPDKQLYVPFLLFDFREVRQSANEEVDQLSPAAQFILLFHLQKMDIQQINFADIARYTQYSSMSVSRAIDQFASLGLCQIRGNKNKVVHFLSEGRELWKKAGSYMQNPCMEKVWVENEPNHNVCKAGVSALACYTDLAEDKVHTYAMLRKEFNTTKKELQVVPYGGSCIIEIWKYDPKLLAEDGIVDRLSLWLSMQDEIDERVEIALDQLINEMTW